LSLLIFIHLIYFNIIKFNWLLNYSNRFHSQYKNMYAVESFVIRNLDGFIKYIISYYKLFVMFDGGGGSKNCAINDKR